MNSSDHRIFSGMRPQRRGGSRRLRRRVPLLVCACLFTLLALLALVIHQPLSAQAADGSSSGTQNAPTFGINPILPSNQADKTAGYYDLLIQPGASQKLSFSLVNQGNKPLVIDLSIASASTGAYGVLDYTGAAQVPKDPSLAYDMKDYLKVQPTVTVPAGQSVTVPLTFTMPSQPLTGQMVGGVTAKLDKASQPQDSPVRQGMATTNRYQYVIGVVAQNQVPDLPYDLKLRGVKANQQNARNSVEIDLSNPVAQLWRGLDIEADITMPDGSKLHHSSSSRVMNMAPNSTIPYQVQLGARDQAGTYQTALTVYGKTDPNGRYLVPGTKNRYDYRWQFTSSFELTQDQADNFNNYDVNYRTLPSPFPWLLVINSVLAGMLLIGLILFLTLFRKKYVVRNKETERYYTTTALEGTNFTARDMDHATRLYKKKAEDIAATSESYEVLRYTKSSQTPASRDDQGRGSRSSSYAAGASAALVAPATPTAPAAPAASVAPTAPATSVAPGPSAAPAAPVAPAAPASANPSDRKVS